MTHWVTASFAPLFHTEHRALLPIGSNAKMVLYTEP